MVEYKLHKLKQNLIVLLLLISMLNAMTIQIFITHNGTNKTYGENYTVAIYDGENNLITYNNSSLFIADEYGQVVLPDNLTENSSLISVFVYNESNDLVFSAGDIYRRTYIPIWLDSEIDNTQPIFLTRIVKVVLEMKGVLFTLWVGLTLVLISLFRLSEGLILGGLLYGIPFFLLVISGVVNPNDAYIIITFSAISVIAGIFLRPIKKSRRG